MQDQAPTSTITQQMEPPPPEQQLQVGDIKTLLDAIYLAASRGAFKPNEFSLVGGSFDRVLNFLTSIGVVVDTSAAE
jgi:hypothetical protein